MTVPTVLLTCLYFQTKLWVHWEWKLRVYLFFFPHPLAGILVIFTSLAQIKNSIFILESGIWRPEIYFKGLGIRLCFQELQDRILVPLGSLTTERNGTPATYWKLHPQEPCGVAPKRKKPKVMRKVIFKLKKSEWVTNRCVWSYFWLYAQEWWLWC